MEPGASIGRLGFRRWYERQLLEGHAWLVTCLLCGFAALALLEGLDFAGAFTASVVRLALAFLAGFVGWHGFRRYAAMMVQAGRLADHATCASCGTYGSFEVLAQHGRLPVRCRGCGHEWYIG